MQQLKGFRHFNVAPKTFLLPAELGDFQAHWAKGDRGERYIVKPVASSQGRGIFLVSHPSQVPTEEPLVVSRYISNPLLVDGYKVRCGAAWQRRDGVTHRPGPTRAAVPYCLYRTVV